MKVRIDKPFRSRKYQRVMMRGEIVDGSEDWAHKIEEEGLGKIIGIKPKVQKRIKKVLSKEIETASVDLKDAGS